MITKTITAKPGELIHVETPNGIVNIRTGLTDQHGRSVDSVETLPDRYAGERKVMRRGAANVRLIRCKRARA